VSLIKNSVITKSLFFVLCLSLSGCVHEGIQHDNSISAFSSMPIGTEYARIKYRFGLPLDAQKVGGSTTILAYQFDEYRCEVQMNGLESSSEPSCSIDLAAHIESERESRQRSAQRSAAAMNSVGQAFSQPQQAQQQKSCTSRPGFNGVVQTTCY